MSYLLTKLLPLIVYPLGLAIILSVTGCLLLWIGKKRRAYLLMVLSITLLWGSSTKVAADFVLASLEQDYPPLEAEKMPQAEAIVILGGMIRGTVSGTGLADLDDAADRIIHGARLFKAGKSPLIIVSGGSTSGYQPEAEAMADMLKFMNIPAEKVLLESASRNTWENGVNTIKILKNKGINSILLVTSASHMRRAQAVFEKLGMNVLPAATDYQLVEYPASMLDWLPQAGNLEMTTKGIKEYLGWWVYSLKFAGGTLQ